MITAAHVGIGISGLEGQQASRSADYSIGQFSFLVPLMFFHGRECYRRNAYLIIYMFYKNILFVMPLFWFGFWNVFSGQTLYENLLYQMYNLIFTAFPIGCYAVMDFQYRKQEFLKRPKLYRIGLEDMCFSTGLFQNEMAFALLNGLIILVVVFQCQEDFWVAACTVYAAVILIANLRVAQKLHNHTLLSTVILILSPVTFFLQFYIEAQFADISQATIYKVFG